MTSHFKHMESLNFFVHSFFRLLELGVRLYCTIWYFFDNSIPRLYSKISYESSIEKHYFEPRL